MKAMLVKFAKRLGVEVFGFILARVLDAIPEKKAIELGDIGGDFFQREVTPWIGEGNEQRIQYLLCDMLKAFNDRLDLVEG